MPLVVPRRQPSDLDEYALAVELIRHNYQIHIV